MAGRRPALASLLVLYMMLASSQAFYLPGVMPVDYQEHDAVKVRVNRLDSVRTQLPFEYYSLPFCKPQEVEHQGENLGQTLHGDRIETSMYEVGVLKEEACKVLCTRQYSQHEMAQFSEKIREEYRAHWVVDNIPAAHRLNLYSNDADAPPEERYSYERGFLIGFVGGGVLAPGGGYLSHQPERTAELGVPYINNHLRLVFKYHAHEDDDGEVASSSTVTGSRIVGFEVFPASVKHTYTGSKYDKKLGLTSCSVHNPIWSQHHLYPEQMVMANVEPQRTDEPDEVIWTYDIKWEPSDIRWASRWDLYMYMGEDEVHWFSIVNSLLVVVFLGGIVAMIMIRALKRDILTYNDINEEEMREDTGWKLVHAEVFRPPANLKVLCALIGSGIQVLLCAVVILFFALLGFLSPSNRGWLVTTMLFVMAFLGAAAGATSAYIYKALGGADWRGNTILTACLIPSIGGTIFMFINMFVWHEGSTVAIPFLQLFELFLLYICVYVPLVFVGAFSGYKREPFPMPCRVLPIPRMVPAQAWHMQPAFSVMLGGVVPFGAVFIELYFILSSIWMHKFYYLFGFLLLVFLILVATCSEISIVMCYFQLCSEDHHWWWRSFLTAGAAAFWMYLYSIYYFYGELEISGFVPALLYFGHNFIVCMCFFVMTGTVGIVSCFFFIEKIYSSIKVD